MVETPPKKILLLTLVHPDFLPPVYAIAQVLRGEGYSIHILTFDSYVTDSAGTKDGIVVESVGMHHGKGLRERLRLRSAYQKRARMMVAEGQGAIISFCAFTLLCGLKVKGDTPLAYHALEVADFMWSSVRRSPLSQINNLLALRRLHRVDFLATPSIQRSAWLAGRCRLNRMPETMRNTGYVGGQEEYNSADFERIVPAALRQKKIILYTGAVNKRLCVLELLQAFCMVDDESSALIITGMKENDYCNQIKGIAAACVSQHRILLLPYVTRAEMLALQIKADIGACLMRENPHDLESVMIAPNKAGEYLVKGLYMLACRSEYMVPMAVKGVASLAATPDVPDVVIAMRQALAAIQTEGYKDKIAEFVQEFYCMERQARPLTDFLKKVTA